MLDGAELALVLATNPDVPAAALSAYESPMFKRGTAATEKSARTMEPLMPPRDARGMLAFFQGRG